MAEELRKDPILADVHDKKLERVVEAHVLPPNFDRAAYMGANGAFKRDRGTYAEAAEKIIERIVAKDLYDQDAMEQEIAELIALRGKFPAYTAAVTTLRDLQDEAVAMAHKYLQSVAQNAMGMGASCAVTPEGDSSESYLQHVASGEEKGLRVHMREPFFFGAAIEGRGEGEYNSPAFTLTGRALYHSMLDQAGGYRFPTLLVFIGEDDQAQDLHRRTVAETEIHLAECNEEPYFWADPQAKRSLPFL